MIDNSLVRMGSSCGLRGLRGWLCESIMQDLVQSLHLVESNPCSKHKKPQALVHFFFAGRFFFFLQGLFFFFFLQWQEEKEKERKITKNGQSEERKGVRAQSTRFCIYTAQIFHSAVCRLPLCAFSFLPWPSPHFAARTPRRNPPRRRSAARDGGRRAGE
ncbi:hypothetical protein BDZ88DRAFT_320439 [Geranomyces variabilis]|nr:hypothetical protein BDZ88DRAFT_320439 [Geranomyces variabilis]